MAILATYVNAGDNCLGLGQNCLAHSLPTAPDFVAWSYITGAGSVPDFVSRGGVGVFARGPIANQRTEGLFIVFHSITR